MRRAHGMPTPSSRSWGKRDVPDFPVVALYREHLGRHPATGSPRYAHELNLPGLRSWPLTRYPYLIFYVERPDHVDVWRVLQGQRDIPAWMQDPEAI